MMIAIGATPPTGFAFFNRVHIPQAVSFRKPIKAKVQTTTDGTLGSKQGDQRADDNKILHPLDSFKQNPLVPVDQLPLPPDYTNKPIDANYKLDELNRSSFPSDFVFGTASAAYQYEGGAFEDGKGPSIWDTYTHKFPDKIRDQSDGDIANDSYHNFKDDVRIMKEMGVNAYRFSISWSRVIPYGKINKGVNEKGIKYYHDLLDELIANSIDHIVCSIIFFPILLTVLHVLLSLTLFDWTGITPFVTLFHFDLPQYLQDAYDGFFSSTIVDDFRDFAELCFNEYGDKVKHWITLNEPSTYCMLWYPIGIFASKKCTPKADEHIDKNANKIAYYVAHNMILSHAAAVDSYNKKYREHQNGKVGITICSHWFLPHPDELKDKEQGEKIVQKALDWMLGWFMDPLVRGRYPDHMREKLGDRLPNLSPEDVKMLQENPYDFLGFNYYTAYYVKDDPGSLKEHKMTPQRKENEFIGDRGASELFMYPQGFHDILVHIKEHYNDPEIYITENGIDQLDSEAPIKEFLNDKIRIDFYYRHLDALREAMHTEKVNVKGYFAWSLLDNFEWVNGYQYRFGLNYVDYKNNGKRYKKLSAKWFKNFLNP